MACRSSTPACSRSGARAAAPGRRSCSPRRRVRVGASSGRSRSMIPPSSSASDPWSQGEACRDDAVSRLRPRTPRSVLRPARRADLRRARPPRRAGVAVLAHGWSPIRPERRRPAVGGDASGGCGSTRSPTLAALLQRRPGSARPLSRPKRLSAAQSRPRRSRSGWRTASTGSMISGSFGEVDGRRHVRSLGRDEVAMRVEVREGPVLAKSCGAERRAAVHVP